jgi:hypothetical protein
MSIDALRLCESSCGVTTSRHAHCDDPRRFIGGRHPERLKSLATDGADDLRRLPVVLGWWARPASLDVAKPEAKASPAGCDYRLELDLCTERKSSRLECEARRSGTAVRELATPPIIQLGIVRDVGQHTLHVDDVLDGVASSLNDRHGMAPRQLSLLLKGSGCERTVRIQRGHATDEANVAGFTRKAERKARWHARRGGRANNAHGESLRLVDPWESRGRDGHGIFAARSTVTQ